MNKEKESKNNNIFKIDEKLVIKVLEFVKEQYKFFFGFFLGVLVVALLT